MHVGLYQIYHMSQEACACHIRHVRDGDATIWHESMLWHGGEAEDARQRYQTLSEVEREALMHFLNAL